MYKVVIGLEVHCQLKTNTKNFSNALNTYSDDPNRQVSVVDLALPGTLPVVNKEGVRQALKMALAMHCETPAVLLFDRKNYFYPDLPKGYQITQMKKPIGVNGYVMIDVNGETKKIDITDTHLEEDTARLDHYDEYSLIDYNRAGIPLLETVTGPCMSNADEAVAYLETLKNIFIYCGASDARGELGQFRCDVNISLMDEKATEFGTKVEMKNINSFASVRGAIEYEIERQTELLDKGEAIKQETRRYDDATGKTYFMRSKVDAVDYKYYTEPNIPPIPITDTWIKEIKAGLPELPFDRLSRYMADYQLSKTDATNLIREKEIADYFEQCISLDGSPQEVANWLITRLMSYLNKTEKNITDIYLTPDMLVELLQMIHSNEISSQQAKDVFHMTLEQEKRPKQLVAELGIAQIANQDQLRTIISQVLDRSLDMVATYNSGKKNLLGFFVGQILKETGGKANPSMTSTILKEELEKRAL